MMSKLKAIKKIVNSVLFKVVYSFKETSLYGGLIKVRIST